jgi:drug/metabolite transporter (DMT)-like permease
MIATYTLWDAHAVTALAVPPLVLMAGSSMFETVVLGPYALARRREVGALWREHKVPILAVAVLSPLAYLLVLFALRLAPVSLVAPARELSIVLGSIGAWLLLREPDPARRLVGAVIVLAGVAGIAAG